MDSSLLENNFLRGKNLHLRELRMSDVKENYYRWMNDPETTEFLESRFFPNSLEKIKEFVESVSDGNNPFFAIIANEGNCHIGNIKLGPINWIHRFADVALLIGEKDYRGKGFATESIRLITDYAFNDLNLHKLTAGCYAANTGSLKAFQKAGFSVEGVRKDHYFHKSTYVDSIMLGIINTTPQNDFS